MATPHGFPILSLSLSLPLAFRGRGMTHFSASVRANVINKSQGGIARPNVLGGGRFFFPFSHFYLRPTLFIQLVPPTPTPTRAEERTLESTAHSPPPQVSHIRRNALKTWTKTPVGLYSEPNAETAAVISVFSSGEDECTCLESQEGDGWLFLYFLPQCAIFGLKERQTQSHIVILSRFLGSNACVGLEKCIKP